MRKFVYADYKNRPTKPREPLYKLPEIADRLGVSYDNLVALMKMRNYGNSPQAPKPIGDVVTSTNSRMYKLSDFKRWMRELQEFKTARQGDTT
jgi:hypothetical protein